MRSERLNRIPEVVVKECLHYPEKGNTLVSPWIYLGTLSHEEVKNGGRRYQKPMDIINAVCEYFKIPYSELIKKSDTGYRSYRGKMIYACRSTCVYFLSLRTQLTLKEIAALFNKKEHTTVLYNRRDVMGKVRVKDDIIYPAYKYLIEHI